jgi:hypothetical protein
MKTLFVIFISGLIMSAGVANAATGIPKVFVYEGMLYDSAGAEVTGSKDFVVDIVVGGSACYSQTLSSQAVNAGSFKLNIDATSGAFSMSCSGFTTFDQVWNMSGAKQLRITVNTEAFALIDINSVPYAQRSLVAESVPVISSTTDASLSLTSSDAGKAWIVDNGSYKQMKFFGGSSQWLVPNYSGTATSGQILQYSGTQWAPTTIPTCGSGVNWTGSTWACASAGAATSTSSLTPATSSNTVDNTNFAQTWNWSTATTQSPLSIAANSISTGSLMNLTTSSAAINSTNGLLNVANTSSTTTGVLARFQSNSTAGSGLTVMANGNVGIGTSTPGSTLDVKGTLRLSGSSSGFVGFMPAATAGSTTYTLPSSDGTGGQFLKTNGSGSLSWASAGGGTPGGSAGSVQFNSGSTFAGSSQLNWDNGNSYLGVGSIVPASTLDVNGAVTVRAMTAPSPSSASQGRIYFDSTSNGFKVSQNGGAYQNLLTGAVSDVDIISITSPSKIAITPVVATNGISIGNMSSSAMGLNMGTVVGATGISVGSISSGGVGIALSPTGASSTAISMGTVTSGKGLNVTGISGSGIGININSSATLSGAGLKITANGGGDAISVSSTGGGSALSVASGGIYVASGGVTANQLITAGTGTAGSPAITESLNGSSGLFFPSNTDIGFTVSGSERMRVTSGGLGINAASPAAALHVVPSLPSSTGVIVRGLSGQTAPLQSWQDSTTATQASILADGTVAGKSIVLPERNSPATAGTGTSTFYMDSTIHRVKLTQDNNLAAQVATVLVGTSSSYATLLTSASSPSTVPVSVVGASAGDVAHCSPNVAPNNQGGTVSWSALVDSTNNVLINISSTYSTAAGWGVPVTFKCVVFKL